MEKVKSILKNKKFYEVAFVSTVLVSFLIWITRLFIGGAESSQWKLFFDGVTDFLADTLNVIGYSGERDVYNNTYFPGLGGKAYPPLTYFVTYLLSRLVDMQPYYDYQLFKGLYIEPKLLIILIIGFAISLIVLFETVREVKDGNKLTKLLIALAVVLSQPVLFSIERGNSIIITSCFVLFYLFNYDSENKYLKELALVSLAIATALKMTPVFLGVLLLYNKQWKDALRTVIYGAIFFFVPFLFFKGGFGNVPLLVRNTMLHLKLYESWNGCTLYACLIQYGLPYSDECEMIVSSITNLICILLLCAGFVIKNKRIIALNLLMIIIIMPSHSEYYNVLYLLPAIIMFLNDDDKKILDIIELLAYLSIMMVFYSQHDMFWNYHLAIMVLVIICIIRTTKEVKGYLKNNKQTKVTEE